MFAEIDDRREQVHQVHQNTFRWIFEKGNETGFAEWLSSGDDIFWINGKPASGKSTLMKYITRETRMQQLLQLWTGEAPLLVASFWFWAAGSQIQRSLSGLYRSLLYQILKADERLCRIAFPEWQPKFAQSDPTMAMLTAAMKSLLGTEVLSTKFFFAIDGLDEYDRDSIGKTELAQMFKDLARSERFKLLVSSRPEAAFETVFYQCPALRLELLTKDDILSYVHSRLQASQFWRKFSDSEQSEINEIESFIVKNASGVFLWVALAMDVALDGINSYEQPSTIHDRVRLLPPELNSLFEHIMHHRIPQHCREEAFRYLLMTYQWQKAAAKGPLVETIVITAQRASSYPRACELARSDEAEIDAAELFFSSRLAHRCYGLLECVDSGWVRRKERVPALAFLHRTLFDYLNDSEGVRHLLESEAGGGYDVNTALMAGLVRLAEVPGSISNSTTTSGMADYRSNFLWFNTLAECSTGLSRSKLITAYDRVEASKGKKLTRNSGIEPLPNSDMLQDTINACSTLYLEELLQNRVISDVDELSRLLGGHLLIKASPTQRGRFTVCNVEAVALLLAHGADPMYNLDLKEDWSSYGIVLSRLKMVGEGHETESFLRCLLLFYNLKPDSSKSFITLHTDRTSLTLERLLRGSDCCDSIVSLERCECKKARAWRPLALETVLLHKKYRKEMEAERARTKDPRGIDATNAQDQGYGVSLKSTSGRHRSKRRLWSALDPRKLFKDL